MPHIFEFSVTIEAKHIDGNGHVNNLEYVKLALDAGGKHWRAVTTDAQKEACLWVVKRHEIDYIAQSFEGDELLVNTWIENAEGAVCHRHIIITNAITNKVISKIITQWYLLNAQTKKPMRIDAEIRKLFLKD
jgi:acyl-CoA thioester hydrolase